jgi:hypothetical protein
MLPPIATAVAAGAWPSRLPTSDASWTAIRCGDESSPSSSSTPRVPAPGAIYVLALKNLAPCRGEARRNRRESLRIAAISGTRAQNGAQIQRRLEGLERAKMPTCRKHRAMELGGLLAHHVRSGRYEHIRRGL